MNKITRQLKKLPDTPGIYLFYNSQKNLIYVGKATSLRDRVRSYFRANSPLSPSWQRGSKLSPSVREGVVPLLRDGGSGSRPIVQMIHQVADIKYKTTDSVLEAVILEGQYIKKYRPKYNIDWKDDKSWNYIVITKDRYPRVETVRERELKIIKLKIKNYFGPYPGLNTAATMKILRRIFKFSTCQNVRTTNNTKLRTFARPAPRPCFYYQIGQCLGVCTGEISPAAYKQKVIRPLAMFLSGKKSSLIRSLNTKMVQASKARDFEEAARLRDQIKALQRIQDVALLNKDWLARDPLLLRRGRGGGLGRFRIEAYDISNLGISDKVGSMVVFENGEPKKSDYRKFNIKTVAGQSDVDCLAEVLERRLRHACHPEFFSGPFKKAGRGDGKMLKQVQHDRHCWPLPDVFLVDGGRAQVNRVKKVIHSGTANPTPTSPWKGEDVFVVGIAKGPTRKNNEIILGFKDEKMRQWVYSHVKLLIAARDEAHRFAIKFNRSKRRIGGA